VSEMVNELALERREERRAAFRALLLRPLLGQPEAAEAFRLVRKHEDELRRRANDLLGYQLAVRADHARLYRPAWRLDASRPATVPSSSKPRDRWTPFTPRHYVFLYLILSLLEERHSLAQLPLTELADEVGQLAVEIGAPIDFDERQERRLFVDVLKWFGEWGVVSVSDGESQDSYVERGRDGDCLLTVDQGRLGSLASAHRPLTEISHPTDLLHEGEYAPTDDGRRARIRHTLARRLIEDPVVYVDELEEDELNYFRAQRPTNLTKLITDATGLRAEHRAEGTAFVDPERKLTDTRFPVRGFDRQLPLLLCVPLAATLDAGRLELAFGEVRGFVRELLERHHAQWSVDPDNLGTLDHVTEEALYLLARMRLVEITPFGARALPAVHRYRNPSIRTTKKEQAA
jgi:uncharacterized protein (TIGR02678 family)